MCSRNFRWKTALKVPFISLAVMAAISMVAIQHAEAAEALVPAVSHPAGDVNGDGAVDNKDLTRLFQHLSDWDVEVVEGNLDTNGDGAVDNKDLTRLFQHLSDWDVELHGGLVSGSGDEPGPDKVSVSTGPVFLGETAILSCAIDGHSAKDLESGLPEGVTGIMWQSSSDGGETWSTCTNAGSDTAQMKVVATEKGVGIFYRAVVLGSDGKESMSDAVALDVEDMVAEVAANEAAYGGTFVMKCMVDNADGHTLSYQWQVSSGATEWEDVDGQVGPTYSLVATVESTSAQYRCVVTNGLGAVSYSEAFQPVVKSDVPNVRACAHVRDLAWLDYVDMGQIAGTTGRSLRLEAVKIKLVDGSGSSAITYRVHTQDVGWGPWKKSDEVAGTTDRSLRAEAIEVKLIGEYSKVYDLYYRVHVADVGWLGWAKDGETAGSVGLKKAVEAVQVMLFKKGEQFDVGGAHQLHKPKLTYCAHVMNVGWQQSVGESAVAGTTDQSLRMEAIKIEMPDIFGDGNAITYRAHVSDVGWMGWVMGGQVAGTTGEQRQMECVQIALTGYASSFFDVYYRVHVADIGWLGWARNGEPAGTTEGGRRLEAIQIKLVEKGSDFDRGGESYRNLKQEPVSQKSVGEEIVNMARTQLGVPYVWGGQKPNVCFDCSGLTQWCYSQVGIGIPRTSGSQKSAGNVVPLNQARVGDILWRNGHVALYIGGNQYLHAPHTGDVVKIATGINYFSCAVQYY